MFTYIKLKNFKSLKNIEFKLNKTRGDINKFVAIYGENGSGKTNIVESFKFLQQTLISRTVDIATNKIPNEIWSLRETMQDKVPSEFDKIFQLSLNLNSYRMIDEIEDTVIEYGFKINDKEGFYNIKFNKEITEENLYYITGKQRGYLFKIKKEENKVIESFNNNTFIEENYNKELKEIRKKYWGKYSFLSLLLFEILEKNKEYVFNNISEHLLNVINEMISMTVKVDKSSIKILPDNLMKNRKIDNLERGVIEKEQLKDLEKHQSILNVFFTQAYADIKSVEYRMEVKEEKLKYELFFNKMIGGKIKSIPARLESDGTKKILNQFDTLIGALVGETAIIDEIDNGIHDILMKNIITSIKDEITGQLIITTHNTLLLESLSKESIYILSTDYQGNKSINCLKDYDLKLQKNNNARDLYLKGVFGGIPLTGYIDFEEIKYSLEEYKDTNGNKYGKRT